MKLWDKGYATDSFVEEFTVGRDREMDLYLAEADVLGNMAHMRMLNSFSVHFSFFTFFRLGKGA